MSTHDALRHLVDITAVEHHCPTIAWGLVRDGALSDSGGVGVLHDGSTPDQHTVYRIASMTKSFTAAAVLALRDEGVVALDLPVAEYAPELAPVRGPEGAPAITLRHLLSMTSGLPTDDPWADRHLDMSIDEVDEIYRAGALFAFQPNDSYEYSNLGFAMIGRCVRRATGRSVQAHITERFLLPLGLHDTSWTEPEHDRWARPFRWQDGAHVTDEPHPIGDGEIAPMGGLWTTVHDLAQWVSWLDSANSTPYQPDAVGLSASSRREMQRWHTYIGVSDVAGGRFPSGYGFGLRMLDHTDLGPVVAHSGGVPGYGSNMRWVGGSGVGAIALANTTYAPMGGLTLQMLQAVHELEGVVRPARPVSPELAHTARRLLALLHHWDDAVADELFCDNVALDESYARRRDEIGRVMEVHGPLELLAIHPESATSGDLEVRGSGEGFRIRIELGPMLPPLVQAYYFPD